MLKKFGYLSRANAYEFAMRVIASGDRGSARLSANTLDAHDYIARLTRTAKAETGDENELSVFNRCYAAWPLPHMAKGTRPSP